MSIKAIGYNLWSYCNNNPIMNLDEDGNEAVSGLLIFGVIVLALYCLIYLKGDTINESNITANDININGSNNAGYINVDINKNRILISDSYKVKDIKDKIKILEIIMESKYYKEYGYYRNINGYLSEWNAHDFAYYLPFGNDWKITTGSVDLNKNAFEDPFIYIYGIFIFWQ